MSIFDKLRDYTQPSAPAPVTRNPRAKAKNGFVLKNGIAKKEILAMVAQYGSVTTRQVLDFTNIPESTTHWTLKALVEERKLRRERKGRNGYVYLPYRKPRAKKAVANDDANYEKIVKYVVAHQGKRYSMKQMAEAIGLEAGKVYQLSYKLVKEGVLPKDYNLGKEEVVADDPTPAPVKESPKKAPKQESLTQNIEFLVWQYVKDTRSTDVLQFLTWIEAKSK